MAPFLRQGRAYDSGHSRSFRSYLCVSCLTGAWPSAMTLCQGSGKPFRISKDSNMAKNPNWTRDELILALELYMRVNPVHTSDKDPEIIALSEMLNSLPIHSRTEQREKFRNPNGVYMKLCNFLRLDPNYAGAGLQRGGKLEENVWKEFAQYPTRLKATAAAILAGAEFIPRPNEEESAIDEEDEFPEGRLLTELHKRRERNPVAVQKKKKKVIETTGSLACEACGFDFSVTYGPVGHGFAECHHRKPLSELMGSQKTRLEDLAIVCANCHRMLHRARPWITVQDLKKLIKR